MPLFMVNSCDGKETTFYRCRYLRGIPQTPPHPTHEGAPDKRAPSVPPRFAPIGQNHTSNVRRLEKRKTGET